MAFTFNWAGVNIPTVQGGNNDFQRLAREDGASWGNAVRGYEQRKASQEYADILKGFNNPNTAAKIAELQSELARLEQRNEEIKAQLGG